MLIKNYKVYFDNYFTSVALREALKSKGIHAIGTIRGNRLKGADQCLLSEKALKKKGRGAIDWTTKENKKITVILWYDNACVQVASNYMGPEMGENVQRFNSRTKEIVQVPCPKMIHIYNMYMGGVDLSDILMSLYRVRMKTRKSSGIITYFSTA